MNQYSQTPHLPVFVYGTLRTGQGNWAWALRGHTVTEQSAYLHGAIMHNRNGAFPFVTLEDATPENIVVGDLMTIIPDEYNEVLSQLDSLEGYHGPNYSANMYNRIVVPVTLEDGSTQDAYTYLVADDLYRQRVMHLPVVPDGDWLRNGRSSRVYSS